ncbi:nucleotidyl transferase AbiEii/AbiGii toxin family protein [Sorangium sp. So ce1153]|uniref:nucleotidyl transferase AbiEii/AbiGii toxin family protein n=1 Tax=Sorangium sp. So ce1153 TaxID=3133333 RepID=UPI003F6243B4
MSKSLLSPLQEEVLAAFFRRERRFFVTGGAALAGFHLHHRRTADLDLFTTSADLDRADEALRAVAQEIGGAIENKETAPTFRRRLVKRGKDRVMVDLVVDHTFQVDPEKQLFGDIRVDPPEEILANKLCALLSRSEIRDLVDVFALEQAGYSVEDALPRAKRKDGAVTPASLAWILSEIQVGDDASIPGDIPVPELRTFLQDLISRLGRLAFPTQSGDS